MTEHLPECPLAGHCPILHGRVMNKHHSLCYNNESIDLECDLCIIIQYVIDSLTPECSCYVAEMDGSYMKHELMCRYGSFMHSQNRR